MKVTSEGLGDILTAVLWRANVAHVLKGGKAARRQGGKALTGAFVIGQGSMRS